MFRGEYDNRRLNAQRSHFCKHIKFIGSIRAGSDKLAPLQFHIFYSKINEFSPFGFIHGDRTQGFKLEEFVGHKSWPLIVSSINSSINEERVHLKIHLRIAGRFRLDDTSNHIDEIGCFDIIEIALEHLIENKERKRQITYLLEGPQRFWFADTLRIRSYKGSTTSKSLNKKLNLGKDLPIRCEVSPHFLYEDIKSQTSSNITLEAKCFSITLTDAGFAGKTSEFLEYSNRVVDALCLYMSFLSKTHIQWYCRTSLDAFSVQSLHRDVQQRNHEILHSQEIALPLESIRKFLKVALASHFKMEKTQRSIRLPLLIYVSAHSDFAEGRFINTFRALEKLVDGFTPQLKSVRDLSDAELEAIKKSIVSIVGMDRASATLDQVEQLTRPGFMRRLSSLLSEYSVPTDDIGGKRGLNKMYKVRNALIHKSKEPAIHELHTETARLETLFERVVFALLNWKGEIRSPTLSNRDYIQ